MLSFERVRSFEITHLRDFNYLGSAGILSSTFYQYVFGFGALYTGFLSGCFSSGAVALTISILSFITPMY